MVVHVCIFNSKGEMLIQKRADDIVRWPGYWDVSVGGGASAGDDGSFIPYQKDLIGYLFFAREGRGTWNL